MCENKRNREIFFLENMTYTLLKRIILIYIFDCKYNHLLVDCTTIIHLLVISTTPCIHRYTDIKASLQKSYQEDRDGFSEVLHGNDEAK